MVKRDEKSSHTSFLYIPTSGLFGKTVNLAAGCWQQGEYCLKIVFGGIKL